MVRDIQELNFPSYATCYKAEVSITAMGEPSITATVKIDGEITPDFSYDWEVVFQGDKYIMPLRKPHGTIENTSLNSSIELTFQHWAVYQLQRFPFVTLQQIDSDTVVDDEEEASMSLNLKDFCDYLAQELDYYYGGTITVDLNPDWAYDSEPTTIEISHSKIWEVLQKLYDLYAIQWEITAADDNDNTIEDGERYVIRLGYPTVEVDHIFEYGFKGGLLKLERQVQSDDIRNVLKGRGGEDNIPLRYFKDVDPDNPDFQADPDWVDELKNIYFTNLRGATFRSYIQGWKAAHIDQYPDYTAVGMDNAYSPWAYHKGYTDAKFRPVEFVADEITIDPEDGDVKVEILPGYSPYVKADSSLAVYGPLQNTLENNDDIYPTLQGTGMDIAVDVEQIESDDVEETTENDATIANVGSASGTVTVASMAYGTVTIRGPRFIIPEGMTGNFTDDTSILSVRVHGGDSYVFTNRYLTDWSMYAEITETKVYVYNNDTGEKVSASGIPEGTWYYEIVATVHNLMTTGYYSLSITVGTTTPKVTYATISDDWGNTFDIWIKNVWNSKKLESETDAEYAERVWTPVLGDRAGNEAAVMFTTGNLAMSEDYEFVIVQTPDYDTSKSYTDADGVTHASHWRLMLAKSDADLESTGLYVPSTKRQGKAGDHFVFIGTEMMHDPYVVDAEIRLDDYKKDQLLEVKDIKPTWVVSTDRVRLNGYGAADALIHQLKAGHSIRLTDKRFIPNAPETLYIETIKYTYRESTSGDAALNPDVELTLSDDFSTTGDAVSSMQSDISALQKQVGSLSNIAQIVRAVGNKLYLRKDGISDISISPTQFRSLLTSGDFRNGIIGGAGWGFFRDENGNWVFEIDRINVRQEMQVSTLIINQAEGRGGMQVDTAAYIEEVLRVYETDDGYACYFDQKEGSIVNNFHLDDVAYCQRWTPENEQLKFYKRRVIEVGADYIILSKTDVNGSGIPEEKDCIIHYGNYTDATRQYVKVRDVVGGGYERYIDGLDSVDAVGTEYYFVGRQSGMYNDRPRWFVGDDNGFVEWVDGTLKIKGVLSASSAVESDDGTQTSITDYVNAAAEAAKAEMKKDIETLQSQIDGVIETYCFKEVPTLENSPAIGWVSEGSQARHVGDVYINIEPYENEDGTINENSGKAWRFAYDETNKTYYWQEIADSDAVKALQLAQASVTDVNVYYKVSESATDAPDVPTTDNGYITELNGWSTFAPSYQVNQYVWQTTYVRTGDGSASFSEPTCISGADGRGIVSIEEQYALTDSTSVEPSESEFSTKRPTWVAGYYYWTRSKITYTDGTTETTTPICVSGATGAAGASVYAQYSVDGNSWHDVMTADDNYMRTSNDGTTWSAATRISGSSYTENLMLNTSERVYCTETEHTTAVDGVDYTNDYYDYWDSYKVTLEKGETYTISAATNALYGFASRHTQNIVDANDVCVLWLSSADHQTNVVVSSTEMVVDGSVGNTFVWSKDSGEYILRTNFYVSGSRFVEKIKVEKGRNPSPVWTIAPSEMKGKWLYRQWAVNTSITEAPTDEEAWSDTPPTATTGQYVWIREGWVLPPATTPSVWLTATRLTGDTGASGEDVYRLDLDNEMAAIMCDSDGNVTGTYPTATASVYKGASQLTSGVTYSIASESGITAEVTSGGVVTLSDITADRAEVTIKAVIGNVTLTTTMTIVKVKTGAKGDKGDTGANGSDGKDGADGDSYTTNILQNSDFANGTKGWFIMSRGTTEVDTSMVYQGRYSLKSSRSGQTSKDYTCGWTYGADDNGNVTYLAAKQGDIITLSGYVYAEDISTIDGGCIAEIYFLNASKTRFDTAYYRNQSWKPTKNGEWQRFSFTSAEAPEGTAYVELRCQFTYNGEVWYNGIKAEYGENANTIWTPYAEGIDAVIYDIEPSVNVVTRTYDGILSENAVTCSVYKTTGDTARELSNDKTLTYTRYPDETSGTLTRTEGISSAVEVVDDTTHIVFELYDTDGTTLLDRERVMIIADSASLADAITEVDQTYEYLTKALAQSESTEIDGGLILTSVVEVGYTDANGNRQAMAGMNGTRELSSDIAFWAGGAMQDKYPVSETSAQDDSNEGATYVMRQDGTGYAANGVIKFNSDNIGIGDSVMLDSEGLHLFSGDDEALRISNEEITEDFLTRQEGTTDLTGGNTYTNSGSVGMVNNGTAYAPTTAISITLLNFAAEKGDTIIAKVKNVVTNYGNVTGGSYQPYIRILDSSGNIVASTGTAPNITLSLTASISKEDNYTLILYIDNPSYTGGAPKTDDYITVTGTVVSATLQPATEVGTFIGNNGIVTSHKTASNQNIILFATDEHITMLAGNYGLRIHPTYGIQYNKTGNTDDWADLV